MRVAMLMSSHSYNGAIAHVLSLARYLTERGHRILLIHRPGTWSGLADEIAGLERFETTFRRWPPELMRVGRTLTAFRPDVINTHNSSAHAYGAFCRLFGSIPIVATAHSSRLQLHWMFNHRVIATSDAAARFHNRFNLVSRRRIHTVPNFIDISQFPTAGAADRVAARATLGLPHDALVVGSVGNVIPRKRPTDLVRAFATFANTHAGDARLVICGDPDVRLRAEVLRLAAELGVTARVQLTGPRNDIPRTLAAFDVFCLASGHETGPISILEAMSVGLPVVTTRVGMADRFVSDGESGYCVDIGDIDALAVRLSALADPALRARFGAAGRARVEQNFTVEKLAPRIEAVLAEAAALRSRG